jgi:succinate dehydrogenase / fumarate reductase cytochrome b subunit
MTFLKAFSSSIGSKFLIAFTGFCLLVFLVVHLSGNLLFLAGPEAFNEYSHKLISNPLVYLAEAALLAVFIAHVFKTSWNFGENLAARPTRYAVRKWARGKNPASRKSVASTTMIASGLVTLLFVVTHLNTFKFGPYYESASGARDLYRLQLEIFSRPGYVVFYVACMAVLFFHLWHGIASGAQSFGVDSPRWTPRILWFGRALSVVLAGGFLILPIYTYVLALRP